MPDKINPYIAGAPVIEQRMFFGREDVFSWIERSLSGKFVDHILVIHGQRRVGKTSVLKHLPNRLPERYIPIFIDLQGRTNTTLPRFLWWLSREISRALNLDKPNRDAFEDDPDFFESSFLPSVEEALGENVLLLTFDEFDTLESTSAQEGLALPFMAILKRLMEHKKLNFIFSIGSSGRKLENMQAAYTNFFKQALYRKISFLGESDARDLITRPVEGVLSFDLDAVDRIYEITSGHPYFIQLICHELFSVAQKSEEWHIAKSDVNGVLDAVIERGTVNLKFVWDEASELEKWVLASLAQFEHSIDIGKLEDFLNKQKVRFIHQDLESAILHLREKDVLASGNRFVIYLMKLWLIQNRSIEQVREELARVNPIVSRLLQVGHEYLDQEDYQKAIDAFTEALQLEEDNYEIRMGLAGAYLLQEDFGRAAVEYEEVLALYPEEVAAQSGYCDAYLALGDVRFSLGRYDEAEYAYQQVLKISPQHRDGRARMAKLCHHRAVSAISANVEIALEQARSALDFSPDDPDMQSIVQELEALAEGKQEIKNVLLMWGNRAREQQNWQDAFDLLSSYQRLEDNDEIAEIIIDLREKSRLESLASLKQQAIRLQRLDAYDDAIFVYNQYLSFKPDDADSVQLEITALKNARKQALRRESQKSTVPLWKRPLVWVSISIIAIMTALLAIPASPLHKALAPPAPTQEVVEQIIIATSAPTIVHTPTPEPLPYEWKRISSAQFLERDRVTALAIHPEDADVMYAGMQRSGVFKTINGGISWFPVQEGLSRGWIKDIIIHPEQPDTIFASAINAGVYRSVDGGEYWSKLDIGIDKDFWQFTSDLFMNPEDPDHILYTSGLKLKESKDNGKSWQDINVENNLTLIDGSSPDDFNIILNEVILDPNTGNYLMILVDHQHERSLLFVSSDRGNTWQQQFKSLMQSGENILSYDPANERVLIFVRSNINGISDEVFTSSDGGITWQTTNILRAEPAYISPKGKIHFFSRNQMASTENINDPLQYFDLPENTDFENMVVSPSNPNRIIVSGESIYLSDDGGETWDQRANGIGATFSSIGIGSSSELIYLAELSFTGERDKTFFLFNQTTKDHNTLGVSNCQENSKEWEKAICPEKSVEKLYLPNDESLEDVFTHDSGRYYAPYAPGYFRSDDFGKSWIECAAFWGWSNAMLKSTMAVNPVNPDIVFLATEGSSLLMSTDGCKTLEKMSGLDNVYVNSIAIHPDNPEMVFAATNSGVYLSTDGGFSWDPINEGLLGALVVYEVTIDPVNPENIYVISSYGIFKLFEK